MIIRSNAQNLNNPYLHFISETSPPHLRLSVKEDKWDGLDSSFEDVVSKCQRSMVDESSVGRVGTGVGRAEEYLGLVGNGFSRRRRRRPSLVIVLLQQTCWSGFLRMQRSRTAKT